MPWTWQWNTAWVITPEFNDSFPSFSVSQVHWEPQSGRKLCWVFFQEIKPRLVPFSNGSDLEVLINSLLLWTLLLNQFYFPITASKYFSLRFTQPPAWGQSAGVLETLAVACLQNPVSLSCAYGVENSAFSCPSLKVLFLSDHLHPGGMLVWMRKCSRHSNRSCRWDQVLTG